MNEMTPPAAETGQLINYDAMCRAIEVAYKVDEVKEIHDKALAIEIYSRLAHNVENERRACEIRLRAERRCGQLISEMDKAKGGGDRQSEKHLSQRAIGALPPAPQKTLPELGISLTQSSRWQKLAAIPQADFDASFNVAEPAAKPPSTTGLIAAFKAQQAAPTVAPVAPVMPPAPRPHANSLWIWGQLLEFERQGVLDEDPNPIFDHTPEHMRKTVMELAPKIAAWLGRFKL